MKKRWCLILMGLFVLFSVRGMSACSVPPKGEGAESGAVKERTVEQFPDAGGIQKLKEGASCVQGQDQCMAGLKCCATCCGSDPGPPMNQQKHEKCIVIPDESKMLGPNGCPMMP